MAKETTYVTSKSNGSGYAEQIANKYRSQGYDVKVESGQIPKWGGNGTESGYRINVKKK